MAQRQRAADVGGSGVRVVDGEAFAELAGDGAAVQFGDRGQFAGFGG